MSEELEIKGVKRIDYNLPNKDKYGLEPISSGELKPKPKEGDYRSERMPGIIGKLQGAAEKAQDASVRLNATAKHMNRVMGGNDMLRINSRLERRKNPFGADW